MVCYSATFPAYHRVHRRCLRHRHRHRHLTVLLFTLSVGSCCYVRDVFPRLPASYDEDVGAPTNALFGNARIPKGCFHVGLRGARIGDVGALAFSKVLVSHPSVTWVDLGENAIGDAGAAALAVAITQNTAITHVGLAGNSISDSGAASLAKVILSNDRIQWLDLGKNAIGDAGAISLGEALSGNKGLTDLALNSNSIGNRGAAALAEGLATNVKLAKLGLHTNAIGNQGAIAFSKALKVNVGLKWLHLGSNSIADDGAEALLDAFPDNTVLCELLLGETAVGTALRHNIRDMVSVNKKANIVQPRHGGGLVEGGGGQEDHVWGKVRNAYQEHPKGVGVHGDAVFNDALRSVLEDVVSHNSDL